MIVTLLTDFGLADSYVAQMKGVLLARVPAASLVDVTHLVPPQDVRAGAFQLWSAVLAFPAGTVHLAVVDPGVGTGRRAVAVRSRRGDSLVGPDNGLLAPALERLGGATEAVELRAPPQASRTFHGRDVFAPAAAALAAGAEVLDLGSPIEALDRSAAFPIPERSTRGLRGAVLGSDAFGNLITNLPATWLPSSFDVRVAGRLIHGGPHGCYEAVAPGGLLALIGSSALLEIAVRGGSAKRVLRAGAGTPIGVFARARSGRAARPLPRARLGRT
ncbi:MAG: SAM hydrolase/SAM-dependent halogenase family protein [Myxococcales bacterium]